MKRNPSHEFALLRPSRRPLKRLVGLIGSCALLHSAVWAASPQAEAVSEAVYHNPHIVIQKNLQPVSLQQREPHTGFKSTELRASLHSEVAYVQDLQSATVLYEKNSSEIRPIASITKLMTALIVAEAGQDMDEMLEITSADIDRLKNSRSRVSVGTKLSRADMLHLALMSSENRAANALGRHFPGGLPAFVRAMNDKARALGMRQTRFVEPTGLSSENVSSPKDLVKLLQATASQPLIQRYTTSEQYSIQPAPGRQLVFNNTNRLVQNSKWNIQ